MTDGDDAHASRHAPLHRNGEYLRWLCGDLLLDIGTGIGAFAFPLITFMVTQSLSTTGLVALVQDSARSSVSSLAVCSPTGSSAAGCACSPGSRARSFSSHWSWCWADGPVPLLASPPDRSGRRRGQLQRHAQADRARTQLPRAVSVNQAARPRSRWPPARRRCAAGTVDRVSLPVHLLGNVGSVLATRAWRCYRPRVRVPAHEGGRRPPRGPRLIRTQPIRRCSPPLRREPRRERAVVHGDVEPRGPGRACLPHGLLNTALAAWILLAPSPPRLVDTVPTGVLADRARRPDDLVGVLLPVAPSMVGSRCAHRDRDRPARLQRLRAGVFTHITPAMQPDQSLMRPCPGVMTSRPRSPAGA